MGASQIAVHVLALPSPWCCQLLPSWAKAAADAADRCDPSEGTGKLGETRTKWRAKVCKGHDFRGLKIEDQNRWWWWISFHEFPYFPWPFRRYTVYQVYSIFRHIRVVLRWLQPSETILGLKPVLPDTVRGLSSHGWWHHRGFLRRFSLLAPNSMFMTGWDIVEHGGTYHSDPEYPRILRL